LSGIAIAIGTMVDVGVILSENIIRHLDENENVIPTELGMSDEESRKEILHSVQNDREVQQDKKSINQVVYEASAEVSGAIVTAVMTTIISFIPVFTMIGAEGKLFRPLAFTKTFALTASIIVALFLIPPFAAFLFRKKPIKNTFKYVLNGVLIALGIVAIVYGYWLGLILIAFGITTLLNLQNKITDKQANLINIIISASA